MNVNNVALAGRLVQDPVLKNAGNTQLATFTVVYNHRYMKDGSREEHSDFIDCKMWGKRGAAFAEHHRKGDQVYVEGKLEQERWQDKESGQKRSKIVVKVWNFEFCKVPRGGSSNHEVGSMVAGGTLPDGDFLAEDDVPF